jgi:hypothetical protein
MKWTYVRINQHFEPYLEVDSYSKIFNEIKKVDDGEFRLTTYETNEGLKLYTYGFMATNPNERPGHGGEWSSNSTTINKVFSLNLCGIAVKAIGGPYPGCDMAMAVNIEDVPIPEPLKRVEDAIYPLYLLSKEELPSGGDYFSSTKLDSEGKLIYPTLKALQTKVNKLKRIGYNPSKLDLDWIKRLSK